MTGAKSAKSFEAASDPESAGVMVAEKGDHERVENSLSTWLVTPLRGV